MFFYINYVGMAGCLKYKRLLCIHLFCKVFFLFFFLFSFSDILAADDYWVKLLRTLQKQFGGDWCSTWRGMVGSMNFWGLSATCLERGGDFFLIFIFIFCFV